MLSRPSGTVAKRFVSAAAKSAGVQEKTTVLENGLRVSSVELNGATSSIVLAFRAGSRYQPANKQGLTHLIRNSVGRDAPNFPGLALVWNTAQNGGNLTAVSNRDVLAIEVNVVRDQSAVVLSLLGQLGNNAFKPWDVEDVKHDTLPADATYLTGTTIAFEQLHQAAFRNGGLGLSNYSVNNVSAKDLSAFAKERLVAGEAVLVGVNVDHDTLVQAGSTQFPLAQNQPAKATPAKYFGGEARKDGRGNRSYVAIAGEGSAITSVKDVAVQAVVAQILLNAAQKVTSEAISVNVNYQDSGLVGVQFAACNTQITQVTKSIASAIKSAKADGLDNAKNTAAVQVLSDAQHASEVALEKATQVLAGVEVSPREFADAIRAVTAQDVTQALSRVNGKLSLAAYGSTSLVPYLDEL
ncbi:Peptidase_M16 domain-containing protein [Caenorhabditis elegans]|uniref:Peptidase_M16 domain-containing protein n=1 Tax=Caenorhabditis elegans TaxID=6239 RepID=G5ED31_CAEEL|nr:Peptidase_M16 domain-containing protein [Caenorhabditis elegans]CAB54320.1 Peptidase_M16 domain-containing protein [Caenorhabditis elegans]|eukprot:NP_510011.1 Ubiquinol-Cytochrome c oxidoReductase complex [Caenorhabditis elegans]